MGHYLDAPAGIADGAVPGGLRPAVSAIPISSLRVVVGTLLVLFGLQWLFKAILRAAGLKERRNEATAYTREVDEAERADRPAAGEPDWSSFTLAFQGLLLEGLEVVLIVLTFGAGTHRLRLAAASAAAAVALVVAVGIAVRGPLARVPENALKFAVGVLLTSFGMFWAGEGVGVDWPGDDAALPALIAFMLAGSAAIVLAAKPRNEAVT
jgi:uncharacterized membrane protein